LAKEYVLRSQEELAAMVATQNAKDADLVQKLLAFFCGERQEPGVSAARGTGERMQ